MSELRNCQRALACGSLCKIILTDDWCRWAQSTLNTTTSRQVNLGCIRKIVEHKPLSKPVTTFLYDFYFWFSPPVLALTSLRDELLHESESWNISLAFQFALGSNHSNRKWTQNRNWSWEEGCCTNEHDYVVWGNIVEAFGTGSPKNSWVYRA